MCKKLFSQDEITGTDHDALSLSFSISPEMRKTRPLGCTNWSKFRSILSDNQWELPTAWNADILEKEANGLWKEIITAFNICYPLKETKPSHDPWSSDLEVARLRAKHVQSRARRTHLEVDSNSMHNCRREYRHLKQKFFRERFRKDGDELKLSDFGHFTELVKKQTSLPLPILSKEAHFPAATLDDPGPPPTPRNTLATGNMLPVGLF